MFTINIKNFMPSVVVKISSYICVLKFSKLLNTDDVNNVTRVPLVSLL